MYKLIYIKWLNLLIFENVKEFIEYIKDKDKVDDILNEYETQGEKGFVYERLWDLVIKFGFCLIFPNSKYEHINTNINNGKPKRMSNLQSYLTNNKVQSCVIAEAVIL